MSEDKNHRAEIEELLKKWENHRRGVRTLSHYEVWDLGRRLVEIERKKESLKAK